MSMGTFDAFTSARLGIYAAQYGLKVTGNNVANINTAGYTRQRLDQVSFKAGAYDRYRSQLDNHVGSGALVMNINQVRDPYLDVRYRNTSADVGYYNKMLSGLQEVADILCEIGKGENVSDNELGDGILHAQLQDLADKLRAYEDEPTKGNNDLVRTSAEILCGLFNKYANGLEGLYQDKVKDFYDGVDIVNECLTNIRDLNKEIRDCEIYGDTALELRDERNRQIDTLSQYLHIKTVYTEEDIGGGQKVEKLSIYLNNANPDPAVESDESMLIDGIYGAQIKWVPKPNPDFVEGQDPSDTNRPYLDKDGKAVLDKKDAGPTDNFDLYITKLYDAKDREWKGVTVTYEEVPAADLAGPFLKPGGTTSEVDGVNAKKWTLVKEAQAAIYSFEFAPSSTDWTAADPDATPPVKGDTVEIGGKVYTIVKGGTDHVKQEINVDDAKDKDKMAGIIAKALEDKYGEKYTIAADKDADGNTIIKFTAKNAGAIPVSERPRISVSSDPTGKVTIGARMVVQAGTDDVLKPPEEKTDPNTPKDGMETITSYTMLNGKWNKVTTVIEYTKEVELDDNDIHGELQATRELLTEKGEFTDKDTVRDVDEDAAEKRGIPYYQMSLDLLARQFATQYNKINTGYQQDKDGNYINAKGEPLLLPSNGGKAINATGALTPEQETALKNANFVDDKGNPDLNAWLEWSAKNGGDNSAVKVEGCGVLFSNRNDRDSTGVAENDPKDPFITAKNISVSQSWSNGSVFLVPTYKKLFLDGEGNSLDHSSQSDNVGHMLNMIERSLVYDPTVLVPDAVSTKLFEGNFNDMFDRMNTICGQDIRANNINLNNTYTQLVEIDTQRDGVSGVDLNDEAMNMMQFQKALNASMRLMTVIDEALDRLINNTGVAGR